MDVKAHKRRTVGVTELIRSFQRKLAFLVLSIVFCAICLSLWNRVKFQIDSRILEIEAELGLVLDGVSKELAVNDREGADYVLDYIRQKYLVGGGTAQLIFQAPDPPFSRCSLPPYRIDRATLCWRFDQLAVHAFWEMGTARSGKFIQVDLPIRIDDSFLFTGFFALLLIAVLVFYFVSHRFLATVKSQIVQPLQSYHAGLETGSLSALEDLKDSPLLEIQSLRNGLRKIRDQEEANRNLVRDAAMAEVAVQVAHDIRSPLTALAMAQRDMIHLPEETRILVREAISRIRDIANNLIQQSREIPMSSAPKVESLSGLIELNVSEKRTRYRDRRELEISFESDEANYSAFALVEAGEFKRVMSNVIDNAVEALEGISKALVEVTLTIVGDEVVVEVWDNGKGIPPEIMKELGKRPISFGKEGGTGHGLYPAFPILGRWGGRILINSGVGKGTCVSLVLPKATPPIWFTEDISVHPDETIVVVDDDESIHHVWKGRFDKVSKNGRIKLIHFSNPALFLEWLKANKDTRILVLIDYEFRQNSPNGLDIINEAGIQEKSILVTSHLEDQVVDRANRMKVKIIPKMMATYVPIKLA